MATDNVCLVCGDALTSMFDFSKWCQFCALELCNDPTAEGHAEALKEYQEGADYYDETRGML